MRYTFNVFETWKRLSVREFSPSRLRGVCSSLRRTPLPSQNDRLIISRHMRQSSRRGCCVCMSPKGLCYSLWRCCRFLIIHHALFDIFFFHHQDDPHDNFHDVEVSPGRKKKRDGGKKGNTLRKAPQAPKRFVSSVRVM